MAYDIPTAAEFKTRFPIYATVDDARIDLFIADAARNIDDSWDVDDYGPAILYLAAHFLATDNAAAISGADAAAKGPITSESFGGMSRSYATKEKTAAEKSRYGATSYGRRYYELLQKNKGGPLVVF